MLSISSLFEFSARFDGAVNDYGAFDTFISHKITRGVRVEIDQRSGAAMDYGAFDTFISYKITRRVRVERCRYLGHPMIAPRLRRVSEIAP
jgi:hypothetical protein